MGIRFWLKLRQQDRPKQQHLQLSMCYKTRKQTLQLIPIILYQAQRSLGLLMQLRHIWQLIYQLSNGMTTKKIFWKDFLNMGKLYTVGLWLMHRKLFVLMQVICLLSMSTNKMLRQQCLKCKTGSMTKELLSFFTGQETYTTKISSLMSHLQSYHRH